MPTSYQILSSGWRLWFAEDATRNKLCFSALALAMQSLRLLRSSTLLAPQSPPAAHVPNRSLHCKHFMNGSKVAEVMAVNHPASSIRKGIIHCGRTELHEQRGLGDQGLYAQSLSMRRDQLKSLYNVTYRSERRMLFRTIPSSNWWPCRRKFLFSLDIDPRR